MGKDNSEQRIEIVAPADEAEMAAESAFPMIDKIAANARSQAVRASTLAMHEYRRRLQGIMMELQDTVRDEGAKLAEQIRQAVLLQTEEKALDLVSEFINGRQAEAQSLSQNLLVSDEEVDEKMLALEEAPAPAPVVEAVKPATEKAKAPPEIPVSEQKNSPEPVKARTEPVKAQPEAESEAPSPRPSFDFASFIARSAQNPAK